MRWYVLRLIVLVCCVAVGAACASSVSFTGTFTTDDQLEIFLFTAPSASFVAQTWGYAGGTNGAGQVIPAGGFDPVLSLFDATGGLTAASPVVTFTYNAGVGVATDPSSGQAFDSILALSNLDPAHTYALVLSEVDNLPNGSTFGDGFSQTGNGDFTPGEFGCGGTAFCDPSASQRNGDWAVDISGVASAADTTAAPEPRSILLLSCGMVGLTMFRRRRKRV